MGSFQNPLLILIIYIQVYKSLVKLVKISIVVRGKTEHGVKLVKISIGNPATKPY